MMRGGGGNVANREEEEEGEGEAIVDDHNHMYEEEEEEQEQQEDQIDSEGAEETVDNHDADDADDQEEEERVTSWGNVDVEDDFEGEKPDDISLRKPALSMEMHPNRNFLAVGLVGGRVEWYALALLFFRCFATKANDQNLVAMKSTRKKGIHNFIR